MSGIQNNVIKRFGTNFSRLDRSMYRLGSGIQLFMRYSKEHEYGINNGYWFGFSLERMSQLPNDNSYIVFICGSETVLFIIPLVIMKNFLRDVPTASDNNWKMTIIKNRNNFELHLTGKEPININQYFNNYPKLGVESTVSANKTLEPKINSEPKIDLEQASRIVKMSIEDEIFSLDSVEGQSMHERLIDMLRQIGDWMNYESLIEYKLKEDSPYRIDVGWLMNGSIHIAIEVQISGNATEAKDRLIHAKRFGARKCIIVSGSESIDRLKSLFRYEAEIKHWVEIWGIERIFNMYTDGKSFFENFNDFNKHQYREDIATLI